MSESEQVSRPISHGYNFHDPVFVEWWLKSLYLVPVEQQVAVAHAVKQAVSVPAVHAEVDLFLAELGEGPLVHQFQAQDVHPSMIHGQEPLGVVTGTLRRLWHERPALIFLGALAFCVLALRGGRALLDFVT